MKDSHQPHFSMAVVKDITFISIKKDIDDDTTWTQAGLLAAERPDRSTGLWLVEVPAPWWSNPRYKSYKSFNRYEQSESSKYYIRNHTNLYIYTMDHDGSWILLIWWVLWCLNLRHTMECPNIEMLHQSLLTQIHKTLALLPANLRERSLPGFEEEGRSVLGWNGEGSGRLENVIICVSLFRRSWRMTSQSCHGTMGILDMSESIRNDETVRLHFQYTTNSTK